ncbi:MAG: glycine cleavage system protein GcvH [Acidimicrobiia bacterium]|nr:glycine cleavage system protein GcvH [Acidimicrobiia bacterium]
MNVPEDRRYTEDHEWALPRDGAVRVGITDYAQDALGDVVFVDLPDTGKSVATGDMLAEIESTKSVAEVYAPIDGTVSKVNERLTDEPELVNDSPYAEGWFVEITPDGESDLDALLDAEGYRAITE